MYINEKLNEFNEYIKFRKVAVIGLGVSNLPLLDYLHDKKANVTIFDDRTIDELPKETIDKITNYGFEFSFGKSSLEKLNNFDLIFRSPSCLPTKPELEKEAQRGAIVTTEIELLMKMCPSKIIGVTGSDGKTTTTSLINAILQGSGYKTFLGGNIGTPLFTKLDEMQPDDIVVLELSSFQLMGMEVSPDIAVVTNMFPDHLNVHKSYEEYQEAKKNIFLHQDKNGIAILNKDNDITRNFAKDVVGKAVFFSSTKQLKDGYVYDRADQMIKHCVDGKCIELLKKDEVKLRGIHNYENICAALAATETVATQEQQLNAIKNFNGVEHRLEFVRELNGVRYYNDSIGTSPASTIAGLNAFDENIVLLAGGSDKGLDYKEIGEKIAQKVGTLILTGPTSEKIENATIIALGEIQDKKIDIIHCTNLEEAVKMAKQKAVTGDVVLLSPASASFDAFKNFEERGKKFKQYVNELN